MAARRADLDPTSETNSQLGRPSPSAGRPSKLYGTTGRVRSGKRYRPKWRRTASSNAPLPYEPRRCEGYCRLSEVLAARAIHGVMDSPREMCFLNPFDA